MSLKKEETVNISLKDLGELSVFDQYQQLKEHQVDLPSGLKVYDIDHGQPIVIYAIKNIPEKSHFKSLIHSLINLFRPKIK